MSNIQAERITYYARANFGYWHICVHDVDRCDVSRYIRVRSLGLFARALVRRKVGHDNFRIAVL